MICKYSCLCHTAKQASAEGEILTVLGKFTVVVIPCSHAHWDSAFSLLTGTKGQGTESQLPLSLFTAAGSVLPYSLSVAHQENGTNGKDRVINTSCRWMFSVAMSSCSFHMVENLPLGTRQISRRLGLQKTPSIACSPPQQSNTAVLWNNVHSLLSCNGVSLLFSQGGLHVAPSTAQSTSLPELAREGSLESNTTPFS